MEFNQRFKKCRTDTGLTQEQLAERIGVSQNTINKIESGLTKKPRNIYEFISFFKVNPEWLLKNKGEQYKSDTIAKQLEFSDDSKKVESISELELSISRSILDAPQDVQDVIQSLILRYKTNEQDGTETARAIKTLLGLK